MPGVSADGFDLGINMRTTDPAYQKAKATSSSVPPANFEPAIYAHNNLPFHAWLTGAWLLDHNAQTAREANVFALNQGIGLRRGLWRGRIRETYPQNNHPEDPQPYELYFMFNPTDIAVQYGFATDKIPPQVADPANNTIPDMTTGVGIGFKLLFDRTYEVWQGGEGPGKYGCLWDVMILEKLMGIGFYSNVSPQGRALTVTFGPGDQSLTSTGYFTNVSLTYGTFDMNMTPTRCMIDIQMATRYLPSDGGPTNSASGAPVNPTSDLPNAPKPIVGNAVRRVPQ